MWKKDFGVCTDDQLTRDDHIHKITGKANRMLGFLKRTCPLLRYATVRRTLYLSPPVGTQLSFETKVWSPHTVTLTSRVESVHTRATAWILKSKRGEIS